MNVSLDEHKLGGLRWIVLRGPQREAFRALGEHTRSDLHALTQQWPLLPRLRAHVSEPPGRDRLAAVRQACAERFPAVWAELAAFAAGVTGDGLVWTVDHLPVAAPGDGAARHVVGRGLQRSVRTLTQAVDYLRTHPSAGGFAYTIGDRAGRIVGVEAVAGRHAVTEAGPPSGPLLWHTNHALYLSGDQPSADGTSAARGRTLAALDIPATEPGTDWFLRVLAGEPFPGGVRCDPGTGRGAVTLCTFVADLTAGEAVIAVRDDHPVTIPLLDLAAGHPCAQRSFTS